MRFFMHIFVFKSDREARRNYDPKFIPLARFASVVGRAFEQTYRLAMQNFFSRTVEQHFEDSVLDYVNQAYDIQFDDKDPINRSYTNPNAPQKFLLPKPRQPLTESIIREAAGFLTNLVLETFRIGPVSPLSRTQRVLRDEKRTYIVVNEQFIDEFIVPALGFCRHW